jgi:hypothetical protein
MSMARNRVGVVVKTGPRCTLPTRFCGVDRTAEREVGHGPQGV